MDAINDHETAQKHTVLTIRSHSGLSGDMMLAGLLKLTDMQSAELDALLTGILPSLAGSVSLCRRSIAHIGGWHAAVTIPPEHEHRNLATITACIDQSPLCPKAKDLARTAFTRLAEAEGRVHGLPAREVHFHEVGAADSILDICVSAELFARLAPEVFVVSPLPIGDGSLVCAHGVMPAPAPAVVELLEGIAVRSFAGSGETVTPTAIALLHAFSATFGPWPCMHVTKSALVYGTKEFPGVPNGATFALGNALPPLAPLPPLVQNDHHHHEH